MAVKKVNVRVMFQQRRKVQISKEKCGVGGRKVVLFHNSSQESHCQREMFQQRQKVYSGGLR